jgi:acetyl-CoA carboxylase biotin carboxyl carrier protein
MDFRDLKRILELMTANELSELEVEDQGFRVSARRGPGSAALPTVTTHPAAPAMEVPTASSAPPYASAPSASSEMANDGMDAVISPMVGTFYRAASPEGDVFVKVGDTVNEDTVVCIIEAMKVMNEIKAETRGVIRQILVENAEAVEYKQPLFKVEPA